MIWRVGMHIVCIDDQFTDGTGWIGTVVKDGVYTISEIKSHLRMALFHLNEIRTFNRRGQEIWEASWRFRPLVDTKTDISIFTAILDKARTPEPVP